MIEILQKQGASIELAELTIELANAVSRISKMIVGVDTGYANTTNSFGEQQVIMDVEAENIIQEHLRACPYVASFCSEELDALQHVHEDGKFSLFYDPLDGSSLINVNFSVGTIIGIYEGTEIIGRTPREQVGAMYGIYGPKTMLVICLGEGVHEFTLVNDAWVLTDENIKLRNDKKYFAPGNLRATKERPDYLELVNEFMQEQYTLRYSGGMVPDINHILKKGSGIFMYPGMPGAETGKLRVLYECGPMAYIVEHAGGASSYGEGSVLDVEITELVQRSPIFVGTPEDVKRASEKL